MAKKLISLNLYEHEIEILDNLVEEYKKRSANPSKVNRSTVLGDLMLEKMMEFKKASN